MSQVIPFAFEGRSIRTVVIDGEPWFVGKDVAEFLDYSNPQKAIRDHCKAHRPVGVNETFTPALDTQTLIVPERDVYRLVMRSRLPAAERFEEWVVAEVLPTLRRTGGYTMPPGDAATDRAPLPDLDDMDIERLWLNKITLAMRVYGRKAAREVWEASPLTRPSPAARRGDDPRDPVVRRRRPSAVRPEVRTEMVRRFRNGEKAEALAREIGVSRHAIHIWNRRQAQRDRLHGRPPA